MPITSKECLNNDRKFCKSSKCFNSERFESCNRLIFPYIELIEIVNVIVFRTNRHWVITIVKRSLYGVKLCNK